MRFSLGAKWRRINRHNYETLKSNPLAELSGSLGDLGTLLPLMIALALNDNGSSISLPTTLVFSGLANIATGLVFGVPLPVQPMKAIAAVAISQHWDQGPTMAAGLFVGAVVTLFSVSGLLRWFSRVVPVPVIRGIQTGAGLSLVISAGTTLLKPLGWTSPSWADNWLWAIFAFFFLLASSHVHRVPYALLVTVLGLIFAGIQLTESDRSSYHYFRFWSPYVVIPAPHAWRKGIVEAGLPQLPLTTLNSILAVTSLSASLFPSFPPPPSTTALGLSVGMANLIGCWFGAMPVCHGSGGLAGQYRFGARSGASIIILGSIKLLLGLFAGEAIIPTLGHFPKSLLGVMVLAAGVELAKVGQSLDERSDLWEETERENEDGADARDKRRAVKEQERKDRWMVMLITVAGCLAFKNDGIGFLAGMLWHWGLKVPAWSQQVAQKAGWNGGMSWSRARADEEEGEGLLSRNHDGPEGRIS